MAHQPTHTGFKLQVVIDLVGEIGLRSVKLHLAAASLSLDVRQIVGVDAFIIPLKRTLNQTDIDI